MGSSLLFFAGDRLSEPELCAARIDGHVVAFGEGYLAADAVESPALRAASLRPLLREDTAATHESAAWIFGAVDAPPARHSVQRVTATRKRYRPTDPRCRYRTTLIPDADVVRIAGVAVASPPRTLIDLARDGHESFVVRGMLTVFPHVLPEAIARLETMIVPGKRAALRLLCSYDDVTR